MKFRLLAFLLVSPIFAQAQGADDRAAPSCGLNDVKFAVKTTKGKANAGSPDSGKALVYFLEDDTMFESLPRPTVRVGMDGSWIGATHGSSWSTFSVDPGDHHLCVNWQEEDVLSGAGHETAAARFTAKAGATYFFRVQNIWNRAAGVSIDFAPLDSDEGTLLIRKFAVSTSHPKN